MEILGVIGAFLIIGSVLLGIFIGIGHLALAISNFFYTGDSEHPRDCCCKKRR
ncbi:MAG: hypothetical protein GXO39_01555 [Thermotogae bacterium]|nr:hypothetical protein [Thermotogota bacterium]